MNVGLKGLKDGQFSVGKEYKVSESAKTPKETMVQISYITNEELLCLSSIGDIQDPQALEGATHVVIGVIHVIDVSLNLKHCVSEEKDFLEKVRSLILGRIVNENYCKIEGNFPFINVSEINETLSRLEEVLKEGHGKPKTAYLCPISELPGHRLNCQMPILSLAPQVQDILEAFENTLEWCNTFNEELAESFQGFQNIKSQITALFCHVEYFQTKFQTKFRSLQVQFQKSEADLVQLEDYIASIKASPFSPKRLNKIVEGKRKELERLLYYLEMCREHPKIHPHKEFNTLLVHYKNVVCFALQVTSVTPACLKAMEKYRTNPAGSEYYDYTEWFDQAEKRQRLKLKQTQFIDFFTANSDEKELAFVVTEQVDHRLTSPTIFLHKNDSDPVEFVPPSKPGCPTVLSRSHDQIKLEWTPPEYGAENVLYYKILFSNSLPALQTEDSTPSKQITGLSANTKYKFTVQAVCEVGCSAKSDVCNVKTSWSVIVIISLIGLLLNFAIFQGFYSIKNAALLNLYFIINLHMSFFCALCTEKNNLCSVLLHAPFIFCFYCLPLLHVHPFYLLETISNIICCYNNHTCMHLTIHEAT